MRQTKSFISLLEFSLIKMQASSVNIDAMFHLCLFRLEKKNERIFILKPVTSIINKNRIYLYCK